MSAWIVDDETIRVMLWAALRERHYGPLSWVQDPDAGTRQELAPPTAAAVGAMLKTQNVASVNYRYHEVTRSPYRHCTPAWMGWTIAAVLKAIDCYEYQSCETPDWHDTEAARFCEALRRSLVHQVPGYDAAPWGIDSTSHERFAA